MLAELASEKFGTFFAHLQVCLAHSLTLVFGLLAGGCFFVGYGLVRNTNSQLHLISLGCFSKKGDPPYRLQNITILNVGTLKLGTPHLKFQNAANLGMRSTATSLRPAAVRLKSRYCAGEPPTHTPCYKAYTPSPRCGRPLNAKLCI